MTGMSIDKKYHKAQIWEVSGQQKYLKLAPSYMKNSQAIVFVFSKTYRKSLYYLDDLIQKAKQCSFSQPPAMIIVGNKSEDLKRIEVSSDEGMWFARFHEIPYMEISVKNDCNVDEMFQLLISQTAQKMIKVITAYNYAYSKESMIKRIKSQEVRREEEDDIFNDDYEEFNFKILIQGYQGSGKTQLLNQFKNGKFTDDYRPTLGFDFKDEAGRHDLQILVSPYHYGIDAFIIVIDLTCDDSLQEVKALYENKTRWNRIKKTIVNPAVNLLRMKTQKVNQLLSHSYNKMLLNLNSILRNLMNKNNSLILRSSLKTLVISPQKIKQIREDHQFSKQV
eukprot:403360775